MTEAAPHRWSLPADLPNRLEPYLADVGFPAGKDELVTAVAAAPPALAWLVAAMPGTDFHFLSDVLSTARIAMEMDIGRGWPEHGRPLPQAMSEARVADAVRQRLLLCSRLNANLIRVSAADGRVYLDGRTPDVPGGVMAARVVHGLAPGWTIINRLRVQS